MKKTKISFNAGPTSFRKNVQQKGSDQADGKIIVTLIDLLKNKDGMKRRKARFALEKIGKAATPYLMEALFDEIEACRWEAAKTLITIKDPKAAVALVEALMDKSFEIQWLAAEALIALKMAAISPILQALIKHSDSITMQQGAHHVLHAFEREHLLDNPVIEVLDALRNLETDIWVIPAAKKALEHR